MPADDVEIERLRRRLRALARAVLVVRRCSKDPNGSCAVSTADGHLRDAYGLADDAIGYLGKSDQRPS